jgi:hypothetical protein
MENDSERMEPPFAKLADPTTKDYPVVVARALVERGAEVRILAPD